MSERPEELQRLDAILGAARVAHETIAEFQRAILASDPTAAEAPALLAESAHITLIVLPRLVAPLRGLAARWAEESLPDPQGASRTSREIAIEFERTAAELHSHRVRQDQIAARLRELRDS